MTDPLTPEELLDPEFQSWAASHRNGMHWGCAAPSACRVDHLVATINHLLDAKPAPCPTCSGSGHDVGEQPSEYHAAKPAIDVEALTEALWLVDQGNDFMTMDEARDYADAIAREYAAALAKP